MLPQSSGFNSENGNVFLRNVGICLQNNTISQPIRPECENRWRENVNIYKNNSLLRFRVGLFQYKIHGAGI
jgi:hypothetical protein